MHLKSLNLRGFKSFASATTLRFEPGITAVVGPAMLGNDRNHFRVAQQNLTHLSAGGFTIRQRECHGHGCTNPKVPLFEVRQEFEAERAHGNQRQTEHHCRTAQGHDAVRQRPSRG